MAYKILPVLEEVFESAEKILNTDFRNDVEIDDIGLVALLNGRWRHYE